MLKLARTRLLGAGLCAVAATGTMAAEGTASPLKDGDWSFEGVFGTYNSAQLRRGFAVYQGVCSACHGLRHVYYRNLLQIGISEAQAKQIAAQKTKKVIDDQGDVVDKPRTLADRFANPFPNENAAKAANNGALPPDLSLIAKARLGGPRYVYSLLTGYVGNEECAKRYKDSEGKPLKPTSGQYCNAYFLPTHILAMAPPLTSDGQVEYTEKGAPKATVNQMAQDVTAFLMWAAEPKMEERKRLGIKVILFLLLFTGLMYGIYRKVWAGVKH